MSKRRNRWHSIQDLPIRSKQTLVLLLPTVALLVLAALLTTSSIRNGSQAGRVSAATTLVARVTDLTQELQGERDLVMAYVGGNKHGDRAALETQRRRVDQRLAALRSNLNDLRLDGYGQLFQAKVRTAERRLTELDRQRRTVDSTTPMSLADVSGYYDDTIGNLLAVTAEVQNETDNRQLARRLSTLSSLAMAKESVSESRGFLSGARARGGFRAGDAERFASLIGAEDTWLAQFRNTAGKQELELFQDTVVGPDIERVATLRARALAEAAGQRLDIDPRVWAAASTTKVNLLRSVEAPLVAAAKASSASSETTAQRQAILVSVLIGLALVVSIGLSLITVPPMLRSLRRLEQAALEVAEHRLPSVVERLATADAGNQVELGQLDTRIPVRSRDEIGRVTRAFNSVHEVAVRVAGEQAALRQSIADLFLNLARRSQSLIDRQLKMIDELEREEPDPDALDRLFQLDHLATRMRRNAEDLIVLSGANPPRRWSRPVPLAEVVHGAIGEVEEYTRVEPLGLADIGVEGQAVSDVVHLLAELIENATAFSQPDTRVTVAGEPTADGYVLEIEDAGIGLTDEKLAAANERLERPAAIDPGLSRRLGLYVVARLAARHGIRVQLRHSWCGGITALVKLPQALLVGGEAVIFPPGDGSAQVSAAGRNTRVHLPLRRHEPARAHPPLPTPASGGATRTWPRGDA
ncbi:MAG TPA: nitrate- and nitrite sensing domain-containing protein [Actinomycetes bacterium]